MKTTIAHISAVVGIAAIAGCADKAPGSRPPTADDILGSVASAEQRKLWQTAIDNDSLPPLSAIEIPADPVASRPTPKVAQINVATKPPILQETVTTTVIPIEMPSDTGFVGRARIVTLTSERLQLRLDDGRPLDISYRSPSRKPIAGLRMNESAVVEVAPVQRRGPIQRYSIAVGAKKDQIALVALQDSGDRPISRSYEIDNISIRQLLNTRELRALADNPDRISKGGQSLPVEVRLGNQALTMSSGDIAGPANLNLPYEIVVFESRMHRKDAAWSDTPPFSLHIAIFATGN